MTLVYDETSVIFMPLSFPLSQPLKSTQYLSKKDKIFTQIQVTSFNQLLPRFLNLGRLK